MRVDSRSWTGLEPTWWEEQGVGATRVDDWADRWEVRSRGLWHACKAIAMLWWPQVPNRRNGGWQRGWSVYDGYVSGRGEEWSLWRALLATLAIILGRFWRDSDEQRLGFRCGLDLGHWDYGRTYGGWDCMVLNLYPRCRVTIESDGDWEL